MFLSRGDRDLGVAFQTHPGRQVRKIKLKSVKLLIKCMISLLVLDFNFQIF